MPRRHQIFAFAQRRQSIFKSFHCVLSLHIFLEEFDIVYVEQGFTNSNPFRLKLLEFPIDVHDVDSVL